MEFDLDIAMGLTESTEKYPVNFDLAWEWLEYSTKSNCKRVLVDNFVEEVDFIISDESDNHEGLSPQEKAALAKKEIICLTIDCFKMLAMLAGTQKGKQVRMYFLECEKQLKELTSISKNAQESLEYMMRKVVLNTLQPQLDKINEYEKACKEHRGTGAVINSEVEYRSYPDEVITTKEFCIKRKLDSSEHNTFSKRYAQFVRVGTGQEPPKKNGKLLIYGNLYYYANEALKSIMYDVD